MSSHHRIEVATDIGNLDHSLRELWEKSEQGQQDRQDRRELGLTRCLTHNLIVVTDATQEEDLHQTMDQVLARSPCRAFLVVIDEEHSTLGADLWAEIRSGRGCRQLVLEALTLRCDWDHYAKLPNLIRPLLVSDIPTYFFWSTVIPENLGRITALSTLADYSIVDSSLFDGDDWRCLAQINEFDSLDLAWLRLEPWRRTLAEAFEHFDWQQEKPPTNVLLEHSEAKGSLAAARCLEAWLMRKLEAQVSLVCLPGTKPACEPSRLELHHGPVTVQVRHLCTEARLEVKVTLENRCLMPHFVQASRRSRGELLATALRA